MTDFFAWNPKTLSVQVPAMDDEHQVLIKKMNALHAAHAAKLDRHQIESLLRDFAKYTTKHFADEEAFMAKIGYPNLESHKQIHRRLLTQVGEHVAAFEASGALTEAFFTFLSFWLTSHIRGIDVKYAPAAAQARR